MNATRWTLGVALLAVGCGSQGEDPTASPSAALTETPTLAPTEPAATPTPGSDAGGGQAEPTQVEGDGQLDGGAVDLPGLGGSARRLRISQLRASIPIVAGDDASGQPITWTLRFRGTDLNALDEDVLGGTLGMANYVDVTEESGEPSTLYLKFMDDMARDVCGKMASADYSRPAGQPRTLVRFAELDDVGSAAVDANLRYLSLRFFGQAVDEADAGAIADLRSLFDGVAAQPGSDAAKAERAWTAVCVGMMLSPAFHIY